MNDNLTILFYFLKNSMDHKKLKPKKFTSSEKNFILPLQNEKKHLGVFNGQCVIVSDWNSMNCLYYWGNFGKGTLSKAAPLYHVRKNDIPRVITQQQFENQSKWNLKIHYSCPEKYEGCLKNNMDLSNSSVNDFLRFTFNDDRQDSWKSWKEKHKIDSPKHSTQNNGNTDISSLLDFSADNIYHPDVSFCDVVNNILKSKKGRKLKKPESKTEEELIVVDNCLNFNNTDMSSDNLNLRIEKIPYIAEENLNLGLEESFFLSFSTGCLQVVDCNKKEISTAELWKKFISIENNFLERYIIYHFYRTKGWIVKSGVKFGGDFLLYKDGPAFYHASYIIKILHKGKPLTWREFVGMNRLVETFNKDLVFCKVIPIKSSSSAEIFPDCLKNYTVKEVLTRRWFPSKERVIQEEGALL